MHSLCCCLCIMKLLCVGYYKQIGKYFDTMNTKCYIGQERDLVLTFCILFLVGDYIVFNYSDFFYCVFIVLVTSLSLRYNTHYAQFKGGKIYFGSQFVKVSVYSQLAPRQDSRAKEKQLMVWCQVVEVKRRAGRR